MYVQHQHFVEGFPKIRHFLMQNTELRYSISKTANFYSVLLLELFKTVNFF